jgi:hypothetical protein
MGAAAPISLAAGKVHTGCFRKGGPLDRPSFKIRASTGPAPTQIGRFLCLSGFVTNRPALSRAPKSGHFPTVDDQATESEEVPHLDGQRIVIEQAFRHLQRHSLNCSA